MAHLATALAHYLAKQSASTCLSVLIYSLSLSIVLRILQFSFGNVIPSMSQGCCVSSPGLGTCLLSLFTHRANSRIVTNVVTNWFSSKVRFVVLKYGTLNLALNVPSHVSHLTVWEARIIQQISEHYKRMSNVSSSDWLFSLHLVFWQTKM